MNKKLKELIKTIVKNRLAYHLEVDPENIDESSFDNTYPPYYFRYGSRVYKIKLANPTKADGYKGGKIWDFDLRHSKNGLKTHNYILIGMIDNHPEKIYSLPVSFGTFGFFRRTPSHIRISVEGESKYGEYEI